MKHALVVVHGEATPRVHIFIVLNIKRSSPGILHRCCCYCKWRRQKLKFRSASWEISLAQQRFGWKIFRVSYFTIVGENIEKSPACAREFQGNSTAEFLRLYDIHNQRRCASVHAVCSYTHADINRSVGGCESGTRVE